MRPGPRRNRDDAPGVAVLRHLLDLPPTDPRAAAVVDRLDHRRRPALDVLGGEHRRVRRREPPATPPSPASEDHGRLLHEERDPGPAEPGLAARGAARPTLVRPRRRRPSSAAVARGGQPADGGWLQSERQLVSRLPDHLLRPHGRRRQQQSPGGAVIGARWRRGHLHPHQQHRERAAERAA